MDRHVMRRTVTAASAAVALTLSGCSAERDDSRPGPTSSTPVVAAETPSASPRPGVPKAGSMEEPATSSGPLDKSSFPTPRQLGPGWHYAVDPGSAEEGYSGNGTPTLARRPAEIVQTAVPFGCPRTAPMPAPEHALEVDYRLRGAKVIAIRGQFADRATASSFFTGRERNLRRCSGRSGSTAIGRLVEVVGRPGAGALVTDRTPTSDPWREVSVRDGDSVVLVAAQGADLLSAPTTRRLVRMFRR